MRRTFCLGAGPAGRDVSISVEPRINDRIRTPQVRVVGADGEQLGVMDTQVALRMASQQDLDMVEVAPMARPPVVKLMDYSKFKYEQAIKAKEARRKQNLVALKEMKMRPKIDPHDYQTKMGHVERFLKQGHKVKVTIMFRGREMAHTELGVDLLNRVKIATSNAQGKELADLAVSEIDDAIEVLVGGGLHRKAQKEFNKARGNAIKAGNASNASGRITEANKALANLDTAKADIIDP